jgi:septal ring factor EnvC (AmiA/AmiB activator)
MIGPSENRVRRASLGPLSLLLALVLLGYIAIPTASADEADGELQDKLKDIRLGVQGAEADISRMKSEFNVLLKKREETEASLRKLKDEDRLIQRKIADMSERQIALEAEVGVAEKRASERQVKLRGRLKAMYINASVSRNPLGAGQTARGDLERLSLYSRKVRDLDSNLFKDASDAVATLVFSRAALAEAVSSEKKLREQLQRKRREAEVESVRVRELTEELTLKQKQAQDALAVLQGEAKKIEEMISSLTSGDGDGDQESVPAQPPRHEIVEGVDGEATTVGEGTESLTSNSSPPRYPSLLEAGLKLTSPVQGKVLQSFGRSKVTNFDDMVRSKGVEFSTQVSSDVHAVLQGKVVFVGTMPGYEQVVVIEHGSRSYSLYGRMGGVAVKSGDSVSRDQVIGTSSAPDEKGRNFYFEIRKGGQPINPESVLVNLSR